MVNEFTHPFRVRQTVHDLGTLMARSSRATHDRVADRAAPREREEAAYGLARLMDRPAPRRRLTPDAAFYGAARMAAALPDDDFDGFVFATAALILSLINGSDTADDLYFNWDAFADHYRLADPWQRAALMNGFRTGNALDRIALSEGPDAADCLTYARPDILRSLGASDAFERAVRDAVRDDASPAEAGALWHRAAEEGRQLQLLPAFRYLSERPAGLHPPNPDNAALLPALL